MNKENTNSTELSKPASHNKATGPERLLPEWLTEAGYLCPSAARGKSNYIDLNIELNGVIIQT